VTPQNASEMRPLAEKLLHFSPEPHVIQPLLLSLWFLHDSEALRFHAQRFCQKFPDAFKRWSEDYAGHPMLAAINIPPNQCKATLP